VRLAKDAKLQGTRAARGIAFQDRSACIGWQIVSGKVLKIEKLSSLSWKRPMNKNINLKLRFRIWTDSRGQDLLEYALIAGFLVVAAGAIMPGVASSISKVFSKVSSAMSAASSQS
jgi:pilus assembly protein Flp/PilA